MNYQHQYDLVMAEKCRVSEKHWEATQLYEKAIRGAHENLFVHDQALANELFGRFWLEQGNDRIAEMYMREARALYHQWGAAAKVDHLEEHAIRSGLRPKPLSKETGSSDMMARHPDNHHPTHNPNSIGFRKYHQCFAVTCCRNRSRSTLHQNDDLW